MSSFIYNNLGICSLGICATLKHIETVSLAKALLIMPIISHNGLINHLSNSRTEVRSLEELLINKVPFFSNFNKRFYDSLYLTINSIQFLYEIESVFVNKNGISLIRPVEYDPIMGKRAAKIYKASKNISKILSESADLLYLNLRIEI